MREKETYGRLTGWGNKHMYLHNCIKFLLPVPQRLQLAHGTRSKSHFQGMVV
jgi:hypothetical protein